jgi:DNA repair exonuclease SbcCD nuclease subunit
MRIAIFSDVHLGFGAGTEREEESYTALAEVIERASKCDIILIAGDLFDCRTPSTDSLAKAMEILLKVALLPSDVKIEAGIAKDVENLKEIIRGIPIIAIAGTHERRTKGFINPLQALERAGFLVTLHCNGIILKKGEKRIAIQGMSGVPEAWAGAVLAEWGPKPINGCFNILLIHQSIEGIVPGIATIKISSLPPGFDLYVCGHAHDGKSFNTKYGKILIPGSLIVTQLTKESTNERGFWIVNNGKAEWQILQNQRPVFFFSKPDISEIENAIAGCNKKPIIKIEGINKEQEAELRARFENRAILYFKRMEEIGIKAVSIEEQKMSVAELGQNLLRKNLEQANLDAKFWEQIFELLADGRTEQAQQLLDKREK